MGDEAAGNVAAIYAALDQERQAREISWRQVAKDAGVSPSTLSRMGQGHAPALESLIRLANWAGTSLDELVGRRSERLDETQSPPTAIASYLRTRKELSREGIEALEAIVQVAYDRLRSHDRTA